jgi:ATP-dependent protease HslVU (ClpYQ) peptidase subunit
MTCIIGLVDNGKIYMGADYGAASGWNVTATLLPKVFQKRDMLIGYTTSFRMGQLLQFKLSIPDHDEDEKSVEEFIISDVLEAIRKCLKDGGYSKIENSQEEGGTFLLGYKGRLFGINDDFGVTEEMDGFDACGCGGDFALGAMKAFSNLEPRKRILRALEIADHFSGGVKPPFRILEI